MRDLQLTSLEAIAVHAVLSSLTYPRRVREDPEAAPLLSALAKIRRYADEAFCQQQDCDRPSYSKGMCEPCYRAALRKRKRLLQQRTEVA